MLGQISRRNHGFKINIHAEHIRWWWRTRRREFGVEGVALNDSRVSKYKIDVAVFSECFVEGAREGGVVCYVGLVEGAGKRFRCCFAGGDVHVGDRDEPAFGGEGVCHRETEAGC